MSETPLRRPTIIVIDDDADVRLTLTEIARLSGYAAVGVARAQEALEIARTGHSDLILLDVSGVGMSPPEFVAALHATAAVPVVLVSGVGNDAIAFGLPFLAKPFEMDTLIAMLHRYCPRYDNQDAIAAATP